MPLEQLTRQLHEHRDLAADQAQAAALALAAPDFALEAKVDFLAALSAKGETAAEIAVFAETYRARALDPQVGDIAARAIDIVGTGGDHAGGFNVSSVVALTLAALGVPVMKHGNRGITSKCGSADLLAALGVDLQAPPEKSRAALRELGFCFFFAPAYHSVFKHVIPARQALAARGQRTVFNILGPLINPGRPAHTLLGVYSPALVPKYAHALAVLGCHAGLVAHGVIATGKGIDEATSTTDNLVRGVGRLGAIDATWQPEQFGLTRAPFDDLLGGDVAFNRQLVEALLAGRAPRGLADTIALNVAIGLWLTGAEESVAAGIPRAHAALVGGLVAKKIAATREFYRS